MKRFTRAAAVFVAGLVVGLLVGVSNPRRPPQLPERREPFTLRREDEKTIYLVPYAVAVEGRSEVVGAKGSGAMWVVQFNGARIQVAATEEPDPR